MLPYRLKINKLYSSIKAQQMEIYMQKRMKKSM